LGFGNGSGEMLAVGRNGGEELYLYETVKKVALSAISMPIPFPSSSTEVTFVDYRA
jgi:hypothetical protein